jgi:ABC-type lipoprotein release transport system permease subunit
MALRTLLLGRSRAVLAIVLISASLCVLDLFAGHISSVRARLEQQAVVGERLGHLAIVRPAEALANGKRGMFEPEQARALRSIIDQLDGIALVLPQMSVSGIAATSTGSIFFNGKGVSSVLPPGGVALPGSSGKLHSGTPNGIALSTDQAQTLGLRNGSSVTLTGVNLDAPTVPLRAQVVDVYGAASIEGKAQRAMPLFMPFDMAQTLLATERTERFVVFLSDPNQMEKSRLAIAAAVAEQDIPVDILNWQDQSSMYSIEKSASELAFDSVAGMVLAVIAATVAATISMNALERRSEVGTLRALGMRSSSVFFMFVSEALWMAVIGVAISLIGSGLIAWVVNRAALSYSAPASLSRTPMLVELDFNRMAMAMLAVLAVSMLAALVPAFKAARAPLAPALAA